MGMRKCKKLYLTCLAFCPWACGNANSCISHALLSVPRHAEMQIAVSLMPCFLSRGMRKSKKLYLTCPASCPWACGNAKSCISHALLPIPRHVKMAKAVSHMPCFLPMGMRRCKNPYLTCPAFCPGACENDKSRISHALLSVPEHVKMTKAVSHMPRQLANISTPIQIQGGML